MPKDGDKVILKDSGKVKQRFIFDRDAEFTVWEEKKLEKFRDYAKQNLLQKDSWMLKELQT